MHLPGSKFTPRIEIPLAANEFRQIAFLRSSGRTVYDFRSRRVTFAAGPWRDPDALDQEERKEFLRLIHTWERMMLARPSAVDDES